MSEPFLGEIRMVAFNFPPRGWATCDGQLLSISQYTAVFSLVGTTFGGDGRTTFGLPDLRGRSAKHVGTGPGLNPVSWGEKAGREQVTLTQSNLPQHNHTIGSNAVNNQLGDETNPAGAAFAVASDDFYNSGSPNSHIGPSATGNAGGSVGFDIQNPYLGIYHVIALQGLFPSRN